MNPLDYVAFIEACYRVEQSEDEWLRGVALAAAPLMGFGEGIHAYTINLDGARLASPMLVGGRPEWEARWREQWWDPFIARLGAEDVRILHTLSSVNFTSELFGAVAARSTTFVDYLAHAVARPYSNARARYLAGHHEIPRRSPSGFHYPDSFNVAAVDATGFGVMLVANMTEIANGSVTPQDVGIWSRLGAHVAAGYRLLRALAGQSDEVPEADAIIDPSGRLAHVARSVRDDVAVDALRERVVAVDRARASQRHDPRAATEVWTGLTEGRWSLVDRFDRDGRRFYLARANTPRVESTTTALTTREEQVARAAALGHSNKLIAYELGISLSTVATHLKSAATKLGASSRLELIRAMRDAAARGDPET